MGEQLKVLLQIQQSPMCFLPAITGWIAVSYFSGLVYIVYGVTSQNDIWCASLNCRRAQGNMQRENCERTNELLFLPLSICSWEEKPRRAYTGCGMVSSVLSQATWFSKFPFETVLLKVPVHMTHSLGCEAVGPILLLPL